jgi:nucleoside-diphosphate-sugar epimerase
MVFIKNIQNFSKPKILITGGSGYIGCELGVLLNTDVYDLSFVDFNFLPAIENTFKHKKIKILNKSFFDIDIADFDLIVHLAYITDVTRIKENQLTNYNLSQEKINVYGINYICNNSNQNCKIIYPSTHAVFEGIQQESVLPMVINEETTPYPKSIYSKQKLKNEIDLINSQKNYIIFRLGSVYGLNDHINTKILTNLFCLQAIKNNSLKLFSGGINYKPIVCVRDVAKAIKFMIDDHFNDQKFNKEIYNLSNQSLTVKEIAKICKKYNPFLEIIETNDSIPNLGYIFDYKKIIDTEFIFNEYVDIDIFNMMNYWKNQ